MATISVKPFAIAKTVSGNAPFMLRLPEAATQTFKKGEPVIINSSGYVTVAGSDPTGILGIAAEAGHNSTSAGDNNVQVIVACPDNIFVGHVTSTTAITDVGAVYGITATSGVWKVDKAKTGGGTTRVLVLELSIGPDVVGDTTGRVRFRFLEQFTKLSHTS